MNPLLDLKEGSFFTVSIMRRGKDHKESGNKVIKTSFIYDKEEFFENTINDYIKLADYFGARIYISITTKSSREVSFRMLEDLATKLRVEGYNNKNLWESCAANQHNEKRYLIDVDDVSHVESIRQNINNCVYTGLSNPILAEIPTVNGVHLITQSFDIGKFAYSSSACHVDLKSSGKLTLLYYGIEQQTKKDN